MKISLRRVKCCAECGALVEPELTELHRQFHASLVDCIQGLAATLAVRRPDDFREGFIGG